MKIRTEICDSCEEEIIIRCQNRTEQIIHIERMLQNLASAKRALSLFSLGAEYFVEIGKILFFEVCDGKVYAHTKDRVFTTEYKLFELENLLPASFVRVSRSSIVNIFAVASMRRELVGNGELCFADCNKKAYFSRGYYKILRDKIDEMRIGK